MAGIGRTGPNGAYTIWGKKDRSNGMFSVPSELVELVPPGTQFACELTPEGILYRPLKAREVAERFKMSDFRIPAWVRRAQRRETAVAA